MWAGSAISEDPQHVPEHRHDRCEELHSGSDVGLLRIGPQRLLGGVEDGGAGQADEGRARDIRGEEGEADGRPGQAMIKVKIN